ncbi:MAG: DUF58 domain-containing protein [Propionibacteriaceae bacterium]|jgi:uncharacterized protein (DUF58 family)|nr:DUF58 domain-containing protein [Propionibacteriaceae bacterium]
MTSPRPVARTTGLTLVAIITVGAGMLFASTAAVGVGGVILAAVLLDLAFFALTDLRHGMPQLVRQVGPDPSQVGDIVTVRLSLPRPKGSFIDGAGLTETVPAALSTRMRVRPGTDTRSTTELSYDLAAPHRGRWTLGPCAIDRHSGLGLWWGRAHDRTVSRITVWPRLIDLGWSPAQPDREGTMGHQAQVQPSADNSTVRAYIPGDDLRRVHWRSSARRGELMTRAEEPIDAERACAEVLIAPGTDPATREAAISLAASWLRAMAQARHRVELACGGEVRHGDLVDHLNRLAVVTSAELARPLPAVVDGGIVLAVVTTAGDDAGLIEALGPAPARTFVGPPAGLAVVWSDDESMGPDLSQLGWSALVLAHDARLDEAVEHLARFQSGVRLVGL